MTYSQAARFSADTNPGLARTHWFNGSIDPVHPGWYERLFDNTVLPSFWDGNDWRVGGPTGMVTHKRTYWRGLAHPTA
jgi:hypothetical protein